MRFAVLVCVLAACGGGDPGATIGQPCDGQHPCATGEICDRTDPAGAVCISAEGDLDGDGIPNGKDFCEHVAGGAFDEDVDGIGDECDRCPIAAPPATPDPDGDMVDSPCDPDPHVAGDHIVLFDGFNGALDARWKATTASAWVVQGGELVVSLAGLPNQDYLKTTVEATANLAVQASYRVDKQETSAVTHIVAIAANDPRPAGVASMECGVVHSDTGTGDVVDLETNQNVASAPTTGAFSTASLYRVAAYSSGTSVGCTVIADTRPLGTVQAPITPDAMPAVAVTARAVTARFQWFLAVGRN